MNSNRCQDKKALSNLEMRNTVNFFIILTIGIIVRILPIGALPFDSDQAIVGLMGKHILEGAFPWLYYGDSYAGTLEPLLTAWSFLFNGISRLSLHWIPFLFSILFIVSIYQLGREFYGRQVGLLGMFLAAIPPFFFGLYSALAYGGYIEVLWLGNSILLLTYRLAIQKKTLALLPLFFLGLLWGIAWWTYPISVIYLITSGLFLAFQKKEVILKGRGLPSIIGFCLGSLPFWIWNGLHQFPFLKFTQDAVNPGLLSKISKLFSHTRQIFTLPLKKDLLFLMPSFEIISFSGILFLLLLGTAIFFMLVEKKGTGISLSKNRAAYLLFLFFSTFILIYTGSRFIEAPDALRYILPLYSLFPISLALFFYTLKKINRILGYGFILFIVSVSTYQAVFLLSFYYLNDSRYQRQLQVEQDLFHFLRNKQIPYAYAPAYWSAAELTFNAQEKPVFTLPFKDRYPLYTLRADASSNPVFVLEGKHRQSFEEMIQASRGSYQKEVFAPYPKLKSYAVYHDLRPPAVDYQEILPDHWQGTSNINSGTAVRAYDRDGSTSWTSLSPQALGMYYQIDLGETYLINHIVFSPSLGRPWDFPCAYRLALSIDGRNWTKVSSVTNNWAYLFWSGGRPYWKLRGGRTEVSFPPQEARFMKITLTDNGPYPWSIGELFVYQAAEPAVSRPVSLEEILVFFSREKIEYVYADIGLSAQITQATQGKIKCLQEDYDITRGKDYSMWGYNDPFPYFNKLKRRVDFSLRPAFVINQADNQAFSRSIKNLAKTYQVKTLGDYFIYYPLKTSGSSFPGRPKGASPYYWNGTHLLELRPFSGEVDEG